MDLKNSPDNFTRLHQLTESNGTVHHRSFLSQHREYLYACVLSGLKQNYVVYRVFKILENGIPSEWNVFRKSVHKYNNHYAFATIDIDACS